MKPGRQRWSAGEKNFLRSLAARPPARLSNDEPPLGRQISQSAAFSLIELLFVLALVLILTTLYWGSHSSGRDQKLQSACQRNLEKIFIAMQIYANDHAGKFPIVAAATNSAAALNSLVPRYDSDTAIFICPASDDALLSPGEPLVNHRISYAYYMGRGPANQAPVVSDAQVDTRPKLPGQQAFSTSGKPPANNHQKLGGNFLFCDGHLEHTPPQATFPLDIGKGEVLLNP